MFPYRDHNPSGTAPVVTVTLIALNCIAFVVELQQGEGLGDFLKGYGLRPARVFAGAAPEAVPLAVPWRPEQRQVHSVPVWLTFFTSMFLHGGWMHLLGNMWYLWIFGDNVEDRMGHIKFLVFYLLCGLAAAGAQLAANSGSNVPMVGASGAIAGVLGAYLLAFPYARVSTLIFLGFFITVVQLPAFILLGFWFLLQFFSGMESMTLAETGGVAWWAHVGGFVAGMLLLFVFQKPEPKRRAYVYRG
ncbi:MAG: rhomboid family intramembrane serine protease [Planctomycetes bacterium]|nr:rhomboid family intramembrane serine protease [Planctomycetota bacterium]